MDTRKRQCINRRTWKSINVHMIHPNFGHCHLKTPQRLPGDSAENSYNHTSESVTAGRSQVGDLAKLTDLMVISAGRVEEGMDDERGRLVGLGAGYPAAEGEPVESKFTSTRPG